MSEGTNNEAKAGTTPPEIDSLKFSSEYGTVENFKASADKLQEYGDMFSRNVTGGTDEKGEALGQRAELRPEIQKGLENLFRTDQRLSDSFKQYKDIDHFGRGSEVIVSMMNAIEKKKAYSIHAAYMALLECNLLWAGETIEWNLQRLDLALSGFVFVKDQAKMNATIKRQLLPLIQQQANQTYYKTTAQIQYYEDMIKEDFTSKGKTPPISIYDRVKK